MQLPVSKEVNIDQQQELPVEFIFWRHIPEYVPELINELGNAEVILIETSPLIPKRKKAIVEALLNSLTGSELTRKQQSLLVYTLGENYEDYIEEHKDELSRNFTPEQLAIAQEFEGSGKTVRFLDANPTDNPDIIEDILAARKYEEEATEKSSRGEIKSIDENIEQILEIISFKAKSGRDRDKVAEAQIHDFMEQFEGKRIKVVYGSIHTGISHNMVRERLATRKFLGGSVVKQSYNLDSQIIRGEIFGKPVPENLASRLLLKMLISSLLIRENGSSGNQEVIQSIRSFSSNSINASDLANDIARDLTDDQVAKFEQVFDQSLKGHDPRDKKALDEFIDNLLKNRN